MKDDDLVVTGNIVRYGRLTVHLQALGLEIDEVQGLATIHSIACKPILIPYRTHLKSMEVREAGYRFNIEPKRSRYDLLGRLMEQFNVGNDEIDAVRAHLSRAAIIDPGPSGPAMR